MIALVMAFAVAFMPIVAEAKAGSGASMGSRGSKTFQPNVAKPVERSVTPPPAAVPPLGAVQPVPTSPPASPPPGPAPGPVQRYPFASGFLGGLFGAGLGAMLFGGSGFGSGFGGILGLFLLLALVGWAVRRVLGGVRRPGVPAAVPPASAVASTSPGRPAQAPLPSITLTDGDLSTFEQTLMGIQAAWSRGDLATLRRLTTPEIAGYMEEQLRENWQRGLQNRVEHVHLLKGDIVETWREGSTDYATVSLKWSAVDSMVRAGGSELVAGDPGGPSETAEVWTFVRHLNGPWQLSAIQQL